jgi:4-carboxymuconolactone decarboxylase
MMPSVTASQSADRDRFERGITVLSRVDGEGGQRVVDAVADVSPELACQAVAWAYGEIYDRPSSRSCSTGDAIS